MKNRPVIGMTVITGMKKTGEREWENGTVLDPENEKTYRCKITLSEDGKQLNVRGFIGFSLFGRTQTWKRTE